MTDQHRVQMRGFSLALVFALFAVMSCSKSCSCSNGTSAAVGKSVAMVTNGTTQDAIVFVSFGSDSVVLPGDWTFCHATSKLDCNFPIQSKVIQPLPLAGKYLNATFVFNGQGCGTTKAELNINNPKWYDIADVSLVDGYSNEIEIAVGAAAEQTEPEKTSRDGATKDGKIVLGPPHGKDGNEKVFGLYPYGCDICVARQKPPCAIASGGPGCKGGTQYKPDVPCQFQGGTMGGSGSYDVRLVQLVPAML